jgi:hypothetical protein
MLKTVFQALQSYLAASLEADQEPPAIQGALAKYADVMTELERLAEGDPSPPNDKGGE